LPEPPRPEAPAEESQFSRLATSFDLASSGGSGYGCTSTITPSLNDCSLACFTDRLSSCCVGSRKVIGEAFGAGRIALIRSRVRMAGSGTATAAESLDRGWRGG